MLVRSIGKYSPTFCGYAASIFWGRRALWIIGIVFLLQGGPSDSFHFAILGDRTGETVKGVYEEIWREINREHPDFVINAGDTIQGFSDAAALSQWREVHRIWGRHLFPLYLTPGNHDIWSEASRRIYEKESGRPAFYSFDYKNAHFTVLDNSGSLQLSESQLAFLERDLRANQTRPIKFVFFHQPFWLIPLKLQLETFPFHRLMQKYKVGYVISGHGHQFSHMERDGIAYMMVGSSGGHLRGHDPMKDYDQGWFFHHVEVSVQGAALVMTIREVGPPFGRSRVLSADQWPDR